MCHEQSSIQQKASEKLGQLPRTISIDPWEGGHIQGVAMDKECRYLYCSLTTQLVKLDLSGRVIGSVKGLQGHLGCLAFNKLDGRLYGSLEYKQDSIGQVILNQQHSAKQRETAFYVAIFAVDKINCLDMDAERDGIMTTVLLGDVVVDHTAQWKQNGIKMMHRYGCSGIDGLSFGPDFGATRNSKPYLCVAYGIYGDIMRNDNDYQVLVQYDTDNWLKFEKPLNQSSMHQSGPASCKNKYFILTGNTEWGVQNLEYDAYTGDWLMAVYHGHKVKYPNYSLFLVDGTKPARLESLCYDPSRQVHVLSLVNKGLRDIKTEIYGWYFPYGSTGLYAFGNGTYYISKSKKIGTQYAADICLYRWTGYDSGPFEQVT